MLHYRRLARKSQHGRDDMKRFAVVLLTVVLAGGVAFGQKSTKPSGNSTKPSSPSFSTKPSGNSTRPTPSPSTKPSGGNSTKPSSPSFSTKPSGPGPSISTKPNLSQTEKPSSNKPNSTKPGGASAWNNDKPAGKTSWSNPAQPAEQPKPTEKPAGKTSWSNPGQTAEQPKPTEKPTGPVSAGKTSWGSVGAKPTESQPASAKPNGSKPKSTFDQTAGNAKKQDESQKKWEQEQAAKRAAVPKSEYVAAGGKKVTINPQSTATREVRDITPQQYANRTVIVENHYHNYPRPYSYYAGQPVVIVGGGYSSPFWYAMADWEIARQARWYANNEQRFLNGELNRELYDQRMQNAALRAEIARVKTEDGFRPNPGYVDPEFQKPEARLAMYDPNFVEAAYNPAPADSSMVWWVLGSISILVTLALAYYLIFVKNWT